MSEDEFINEKNMSEYAYKDYKPSENFDLLASDSDLPWVCSNFVKENSQISFYQIEYAISELLKKFYINAVDKFLVSDSEFCKLARDDNLGRPYLIYKDYRKWALKNRKKIKLKAKRRKEIDLCLLGL